VPFAQTPDPVEKQLPLLVVRPRSYRVYATGAKARRIFGEVQPLRGVVVGRRRQEDEERKLGIRLLSDEEVVTRLNAFVEAWEQLQVAERELRAFGLKTEQPRTSVAHQFGDTEEFMAFNRRRREFLRKREDLQRQRDDADTRFKESAGVVHVLLPGRSSLVHTHAGWRYLIENERGQATVKSRTDAPV
jgi:hypothetical protein